MNHRERMLEVLPAPYTAEPDSVLAALLNGFALEMEAFEEDLERMRQSHWIRTASRLADAEKLGALVGVPRLPWEGLDAYRARLSALVAARLQGSLGPGEVRRFVFEYLRSAQEALGSTLAPGLPDRVELAYAPPPDRPLFRPLALAENPPRLRTSAALQARGGRVPYLFRWQEVNRGLDATAARFHVTGVPGGRPAVPVLVNLTTGDLAGYAGEVPLGHTLSVGPSPAGAGLAAATLEGNDVTASLFTVQGFRLGVPFRKQDFDPRPRLPRMARGENQWIFLSVGLYDVRGLDRFFFAVAGDDLREGVFDETGFDQSLFPSNTVARLEMEWVETEPASFEVRVPRPFVVGPAGQTLDGGRPHELVAAALAASVQELRAAGVKAEVRLEPFAEIQPQRIRVQLPWVILPPERGPSGAGEDVGLGGRFGESGLGGARFE